MRSITLQQLRQAVGGKPLCVVPDDAPTVDAVCTDSRMMQKRSVFIALRGERFDAHEHLLQAVTGGAVALIIERVPEGIELPPNIYVLQVADTYAAMGKLAKFVRLQMKSKVIAVAGSNGKTGTKLLIHAALGGRLRGSISPKSFNNNVGVPLTIFPADPAQDYLVLEVGTNHHGEIAPLAEMSQPDIAVITNAGAEHLEGLDDIRGVRLENAAITLGMSAKGMLIVNGDDPELIAAVSHYAGKKLTFGFGDHNDLFAADVQCDDTGVRFMLNGNREVFVPLLGRHTAANALAAIAVGRRLGLPEEAIFEGLRHATGPDMRLQLKAVNDIHILNDAYNANPNSMRAALETLATLKVGRRRIAVLGDMRELGRSSERYHKEIGELAGSGIVDWLACVGEQSKLMAEAAVASGLPAAAVMHFATAEEATAAVPNHVQPGDLVLIKASRGIRLEKVAQAIETFRHQVNVRGGVKQRMKDEGGRMNFPPSSFILHPSSLYFMIYLLVQHFEDWLESRGLGFLRVFNATTFQSAAALVISFLIVIVFGGRVIEWLRRQKLGDLATFDHAEMDKLMASKKGTPTMGGLLIIASIVLTTLLLADLSNFYVRMALICVVWLGAVGAVDDWLKLTAGRRVGSRQGLTSKEKLLFQVGLSLLLAYFTYRYGEDLPRATRLYFPFFKNLFVPLSLAAFCLLAVLVMAGASNSVNLTDGLDGLASGCMAIVSFVFLVLALIVGDQKLATELLVPGIRASGEMAVVCGATMGACLGFLWFNCHPARVFMGDTGSLALGGLIGYVAIVIRHELVLVLAGGIFVMEAVSVMLQVSYFKYTRKRFGEGRRIFLMTPIHHHFQKKGWTESQVVVRFWLIGAMLAAVSLATIKLR